MTFDKSPPTPRSRWSAVKEHLPMIVVVFAAVGVAAGIHLASTAVAVLAAGHLVVVPGILIAARGLRNRKAEASLR